MKTSFEKKIIIIGLSFILSGYAFADTTHKIEKGDTLYSISRKYQITVAELRAANNLSETDVIKIGQKLIIPTADIATAAALATDKNNVSKDSKTTKDVQKTETEGKIITYQVVKGDTLYGIARKFGMSVGDLLSLNQLDSSSVIKIGQKLKVVEKNDTSGKSEQKVEKSEKTEKTEKKSSEKSNDKNTDKNNNAPENKSTDVTVVDTRNYGNTISADSSTIWPVKNPQITTVNGKVSGVQLSAQTNEGVTCIREGTVMYVGVYRGFGQVVFIQSKTGVIYSYAGLGSVKVKKGDYINFGSEIGTAGVDSLTNKSQITFMVFQNGKPINPAKAPRN